MTTPKGYVASDEISNPKAALENVLAQVETMIEQLNKGAT